ncbi:hypothetical protein [Paraburkholderia sp. DHOC27]|uniref:hypothetical protein n=1 Tax=Paraburkholderia sp. DHOC27 TaxID=2303330 RepID=UPI000E3C2B30|nr:hypothetical protein [Paraburkholderia sp. DHOC27]RFU49031.1 hypothetical protein D0B32_04225 [Paraburkholderia sp. DHOC27]
MRKSHAAVLLSICLASIAYAEDIPDPGHRPDGHTAHSHVLKVFDSDGHYVGPVISIDAVTIGAVVHANGTIIVVPIGRVSQNGQLSASQYQWASSLSPIATPPTVDCRNLPVIDATFPTPGVLRPAYTARVGNVTTAYIAGNTYTIPTPPNGQCSGQSMQYPLSVWLTESVFSLTQNYPEPLAIHY